MPEDTQPTGPKKIVVNDFSSGQPTSPASTPAPAEPAPPAPMPTFGPMPVASAPADTVEPSSPTTPASADVPKFGELQPKVDAHPLFSGAKEPRPKSPRRWLKRTMAPLIVLLIVLIGLYLAVDAGWIKGYSHLPFHVFKSPASSTIPTITPAKKTAKAPVANPYTDWKSYTLQYEKLTFRYPPDWTIKDTSSQALGDRLTLTSPNGLVLNAGIGNVPPFDFAAVEQISTDPILFASTKAELAAYTAPGSTDKTMVSEIALLSSEGGILNSKNAPITTQSGKGNVDISISLGTKADLSPVTREIKSVLTSTDYKNAKLIIQSMIY